MGGGSWGEGGGVTDDSRHVMANTQFDENLLGKGEDHSLLYILHSFLMICCERDLRMARTVVYASIWQPKESILIYVFATIT